MNTQELIVVKQLPEIQEQLRLVADEIDKKTSAALSMECSEETRAKVKDLRAELNKDLQAFEERRKAVKNAVMEPYEAFNAVYEECIKKKYAATDTVLKERIDAVEWELKQKKMDAVKEYFGEYCESKDIDFVSFANSNINVTLNASLKSLKVQAKSFVDRICDDLALIETQELRDEILVEYKQSLNCSQAITSVAERHKALMEQEARREEREQRKATEQTAMAKVEELAPLAPPSEVPHLPFTPPPDVLETEDPVKTVAFKVTAPLSRLRELKQFLNDGGYQYE